MTEAGFTSLVQNLRTEANHWFNNTALLELEKLIVLAQRGFEAQQASSAIVPLSIEARTLYTQLLIKGYLLVQRWDWLFAKELCSEKLATLEPGDCRNTKILRLKPFGSSK